MSHPAPVPCPASLSHRVCARFPAGRAHLAVRVGVLEGLHEPQRLVDGAADGQVIHGDLTQHAGAVNDEQTSAGDGTGTLVREGQWYHAVTHICQCRNAAYIQPNTNQSWGREHNNEKW